ncbi:MAG: TonB-dependent receptor family protein [Bacteroidales bacterium]|nr:TonB-dependent receptor family protein [Bacteroidales bacterium]
MNKKKLLAFFLMSMLYLSGFTQGVVVSGKVIEKETNEPLIAASLSLHKQADFSIISGTVTDTSGRFEFKSVPYGNYILEISFIGFYSQQKEISLKGANLSLGSLMLEPSEILLGEVSVTGRKSALEYNLDRQVYNVEKDILAESGSVSDIMQNIPSLSVDIDGNISLRSSGNITFFVNGRPSAMLRRDAGTVLQQMPANSIERIEIITNPSARFRPDGIGGIINIVMKKETMDGLSGQASANIGTEGRYNANLNLNSGKGDVKFFGNYGLRQNAGIRLFSDERVYKDSLGGSVVSHFDESGNSSRDGLSHNIFMGGSYDMNDFNSLEISGSFYLQNTLSNRISEISAKDSNFIPDYSLTDKTTNNEIENEGELSLAYEHVFKDNEDHVLSFEAVYSAYDESEDLTFEQHYSFPDDRIDLGGNLIEKSGTQQEYNLNHILPVGEDGEFESGYAGEFVLENIDFTGDALATKFVLNSQVHALYALFGMPVNDFSFKAGLRAEQVFLDSHLKFPTDSIVPNNYFKIFPTAHLTYNLNDNNEVMMSYSKRINRPDADELNPNLEYSDPRNAEGGNAMLKPEQIHSVELGYQFHHDIADITGTLYYRYKYDAFTTIYSTISDSVVLRTSANLNSQDALGMEMVVSANIMNNWKLDLTGNLYHTTIDASDLGYSSTKSSYSGNIKLNSLLSIIDKSYLQLNVFYYFPTITPQGSRDPFFYMNMGIKQQLFRNKASLTLTASDIFHSYRVKSIINSADLERVSLSWRKLPVIYLGFTWRFNNYKDQEKLQFEGESIAF